MDTFIIIGRIIFGGFFIYTGINGHFFQITAFTQYAGSKHVPMPRLAVFVSGLMITVGGLGVITHSYWNFSLWLIVLFLVVVTPKMHSFWNDTDPMAKMGNRVNFFKNLALLGASLALMSSGGY